MEKPVEKQPVVKKEKTKTNGNNKWFWIGITALVVALMVVYWTTFKLKTPEIEIIEEKTEPVDSITTTIDIDTVKIAEPPVQPKIIEKQKIKATDLVKIQIEKLPETEPKIQSVENKPVVKSGETKSHEGKITVAGNIYEGSIRNGKPHGKGVMNYTSPALISHDDPEKTMAATGDYLTGRWNDGELEMGTLYNKDGDKKSVIRIGRY